MDHTNFFLGHCIQSTDHLMADLVNEQEKLKYYSQATRKIIATSLHPTSWKNKLIILVALGSCKLP